MSIKPYSSCPYSCPHGCRYSCSCHVHTKAYLPTYLLHCWPCLGVECCRLEQCASVTSVTVMLCQMDRHLTACLPDCTCSDPGCVEADSYWHGVLVAGLHGGCGGCCGGSGGSQLVEPPDAAGSVQCQAAAVACSPGLLVWQRLQLAQLLLACVAPSAACQDFASDSCKTHFVPFFWALPWQQKLRFAAGLHSQECS